MTDQHNETAAASGDDSAAPEPSAAQSNHSDAAAAPAPAVLPTEASEPDEEPQPAATADKAEPPAADVRIPAAITASAVENLQQKILEAASTDSNALHGSLPADIPAGIAAPDEKTASGNAAKDKESAQAASPQAASPQASPASTGPSHLDSDAAAAPAAELSEAKQNESAAGPSSRDSEQPQGSVLQEQDSSRDEGLGGSEASAGRPSYRLQREEPLSRADVKHQSDSELAAEPAGAPAYVHDHDEL